jgi:hypothetical protein
MTNIRCSKTFLQEKTKVFSPEAFVYANPSNCSIKAANYLIYIYIYIYISRVKWFIFNIICDLIFSLICGRIRFSKQKLLPFVNQKRSIFVFTPKHNMLSTSNIRRIIGALPPCPALFNQSFNNFLMN